MLRYPRLGNVWAETMPFSRRCIWITIVSLLIVPFSSIAKAQSVHDYATWFSINADGDVKAHGREPSKLKWHFDGQLRFLNDSGGYHQSFVRPGIGYALTPNTSVWFGYAWVNELPANGNPVFSENRIWQQVSWSHKLSDWKLSTRTRLEQRWLETGNDTGWRFRHQAKLEKPLRNQPKLSFIVSDEALFDLNETDWGQNGSFSQNRAFVGIGWKREGNHQPKLEIGYLNQYFRRT